MLKHWNKQDRKLLLSIYGINCLINLNANLSLDGSK